jgi:hypothetical protein
MRSGERRPGHQTGTGREPTGQRVDGRDINCVGFVEIWKQARQSSSEQGLADSGSAQHGQVVPACCRYFECESCVRVATDVGEIGIWLSRHV